MSGGEAPALREIAVGVVRSGDHVLVGRRSLAAHLPGFDEFPGGHRELGESLEDCVRRELREETGLEVRVLHLLAQDEHRDDRRALRLHFFACRLEDEARRDAVLPDPNLRWVRVQELAGLTFPPANARLVEALREDLQSEARW